MLKVFYFVLFALLLSLVGCVDPAETPVSNSSSDNNYPSNCFEATIKPSQSNIHLIQLDNYGPNPFMAACERGYGGGWTVIQRRLDGRIDFYRDWNEYKFGFGDLMGEFWIGLDKLHALTTHSVQELLIVLEDFDGKIAEAKYDLFAIGNENEGYALNVLGRFSGSTGDSLSYHRSYKFSTKDKNNVNNCAVRSTGAWWYSEYNDCHESNLNGQYLKGEHESFGKGVNWKYFRGRQYSVKFTQMMIRPKM